MKFKFCAGALAASLFSLSAGSRAGRLYPLRWKFPLSSSGSKKKLQPASRRRGVAVVAVVADVVESAVRAA